MLFRGTERFGSEEIDQIFDAMGAEINAGTDKETTSLYTRVLDRHLERAFDVMSDMLWRPRFGELEAEREVVLEEIAMYEDDPQDKVFDVLGEAVFGTHPLGRAVIGRAEVVGAATREQLRAFHAERYVPANVVIAAAGSVDHDDWLRARLAHRGRARERAGRRRPAGAAQSAPDFERRVRFLAKDTEQYHVCLGGAGAGARRRAPLCAARARRRARRNILLAALPGGARAPGPRLLGVLLLEPLRPHRRGGAVCRHAAGEPRRGAGGRRGRARALRRRSRERRRSSTRSRENLKGRVVLSLESTGARMSRLGISVLNGLPILSVDEVIERIDAVDVAALRELAGELFDPERLSVAGVGPEEEAFRDGARRRSRGGARGRGMIRVAVAGAAGRMGQTVCAAVEGAEDMELVGRADPLLGTTLEEVLRRRTPRSSSTSPGPTPRWERPGVRARGVHVVIGTTGFDPAPLQPRRGAADGQPEARTCSIAPNFAIGAVLMMRFAAEAARHMAKAEIIELHHDRSSTPRAAPPRARPS